MREVARYGFSAPIADSSGAWLLIRGLMDRWIASKGTRREDDAGVRFEFPDGRVGDLSIVETTASSGDAIAWTLEEPTEGGLFKTGIALGRSANVLAVACELDAGAPVQVVAPVLFEARCPSVLRDIIDGQVPWAVGETLVSTRPLRFAGDEGGTRLCALITSEVRSLPLVVVTDVEGLVLHPGIAEVMARDLAGLAIVATATDSASTVVTRMLGTEWSCYNGALRLYWPFRAMARSPFRHPLWTARRLLHGVAGTEEAARRIRTQLRRKILGLSTLTIRRHPIFDEIERGHRAQGADARRREAASQGELVKLLEGDNTRLESEIQKLQERVGRLEADLANAQAISSWAAKDDGDEVLPDEDIPPASVAEAVAIARGRYNGLLVFGDDITGGIEALAQNAGPPEKILGYLGGLANLAEALRGGALGATIVQWLKDRGFRVSGESETIKNSRAEMKQRTWHDGQGRREFDLHLKPTDATSPDRCVRIYFDWKADDKTVVVGWLGRNPGI
jgi:hypothetical protein